MRVIVVRRLITTCKRFGSVRRFHSKRTVNKNVLKRGVTLKLLHKRWFTPPQVNPALTSLNLPSKIDGNKCVGFRNIDTFTGLEKGDTLRFSDFVQYPLPINVVWTTFNDYKNILSSITTPDTDSNGQKINNDEEVNSKDDNNRRLELVLTKSNNYFKEYSQYLNLFNINEKECLLTSNIEFEFNDNLSNDKKENMINLVSYNNKLFLKQLYDRILDKNSTVVNTKFECDVPKDWLLNYMGDVNNIKWVNLPQGSSKFLLLQSDVRQFNPVTQPDMNVVQRFSWKEKNNSNKLEIEMVKAPFDFHPFKEFYEFKEISQDKCEVHAHWTIFPFSEERQDMYNKYLAVGSQEIKKHFESEYKNNSQN